MNKMFQTTTEEREAIKCGRNAYRYVGICAEVGLFGCGSVDCSAHEADREELMKCLGNATIVQKAPGRPGIYLPCKEFCLLGPFCIETLKTHVNITNNTVKQHFKILVKRLF